MGTPLRWNMILPNGQPLRWNMPGARYGGTVEEVMAAINQKKKTMAETKTTYPVNEVIGFGSKAGAMLTKYKTQMIAAKVDPTDLIAKLGPDGVTLATEADKQKGMETQTREQTKVVEGLNTTHYRNASNACDMVITAFGRGSEEAKEATNLRQSVRPSTRPAKTNPAPASQSK